jgi:hypothetical protein
MIISVDDNVGGTIILKAQAAVVNGNLIIDAKDMVIRMNADDIRGVLDDNKRVSSTTV